MEVKSSNSPIDGSLMGVLLALKDNTMRSTHCCDVCVVDSVDTSTAGCSLLALPSLKIKAYKTISVQAGDVVVVVYADHSFGEILKRFQRGESISDTTKDDPPHSMLSAIIIGKLIL